MIMFPSCDYVIWKMAWLRPSSLDIPHLSADKWRRVRVVPKALEMYKRRLIMLHKSVFFSGYSLSFLSFAFRVVLTVMLRGDVVFDVLKKIPKLEVLSNMKKAFALSNSAPKLQTANSIRRTTQKGWLAQDFIPRQRMLSGPAASLVFTPGRIPHTYTADNDSGR